MLERFHLYPAFFVLEHAFTSLICWVGVFDSPNPGCAPAFPFADAPNLFLSESVTFAEPPNLPLSESVGFTEAPNYSLSESVGFTGPVKVLFRV